MRVLFTLITLFLYLTSFTQSPVLIGGSTGTCGSSGTGNTCPGSINLCGSRVASVVISVPVGSRIDYSFTQGDGCGASTGYRFDGGEHVTVSYGSTTTNIFSGSGTNGLISAVGSGCYFNNGTSAIDVTFSGGGNRLDESYQLTYDVVSGDIMCTPLPIKLSHFDIIKIKFNTQISFATASETNNDYFTIERSSDGRSFEAIGEIKGAGNSVEERHYDFTDENPLPGINYYRIKQTDFDGRYSYSEIKSVQHTGHSKIVISPLHTDGRLHIHTDMQGYDVAVFSSAGQEVTRFTALSGYQSVSIESLHAGLYFVKVLDQTFKVFKY